jgi:hypothetical protein
MRSTSFRPGADTPAPLPWRQVWTILAWSTHSQQFRESISWGLGPGRFWVQMDTSNPRPQIPGSFMTT